MRVRWICSGVFMAAVGVVEIALGYSDYHLWPGIGMLLAGLVNLGWAIFFGRRVERREREREERELATFRERLRRLTS